MWQFPQLDLPAAASSASEDGPASTSITADPRGTAPATSTSLSREAAARAFFAASGLAAFDPVPVRYRGHVGSLMHTFSHLRLRMHVHCFGLRRAAPGDSGEGPRLPFDEACANAEVDEHGGQMAEEQGEQGNGRPQGKTLNRRWVAIEVVGDETLSEGMRRCWELVKDDVWRYT